MEKTNTLSLLSLSTLQGLLENKQTKKPEIDPLFSSMALAAKNDEIKKKRNFWKVFHGSGALLLICGAIYCILKDLLPNDAFYAIFVVCVFVMGYAYYNHISMFKAQTSVEFETDIMQKVRNIPVNEKNVTMALIEKTITLLTTKEEIPGKQRVIEEILELLRKVKSVENKEIVRIELTNHSYSKTVRSFLGELQIELAKRKAEKRDEVMIKILQN